MCAPPWVMFDSLNVVLPVREAMKVHHPDSALVAATTMADGDMAGVIAAATGLALLGKGKLEDGSAFVQVVVYWADKMADSRRSRGVAA
jgi:hypothetical protein